MAGNHDYIALDWVKSEIDSTLNQAQLALEDYVSNPADSTRLRFCLNYIHQVHGTLQMVEFYGAALLAEEMEQLTQALVKGDIAQPDEAIEVLMEAILQLPNYLGRLQTNQEDLPVILLPVLNDLRASRGAGLLSDTSLFTPDLSAMQVSVTPEVASRLANRKAVAQLRKLRQMYQFSLAGVVREHDVIVNLNYLHKVCDRLQALCKDSSFGQFWRLTVVFVEALREGDIDLSSSTKNVLRSLDHTIKRLIDESQNILAKPAPEDLTKHILYYMARSETGNDKLARIRSEFRLDLALPTDQSINHGRQKMAGPDKGAIESVVSALNEELARVKDQLDLFVRSEYKDLTELQELIPGLQQIANTMAVLGLGVPRKVVEDQIQLITQIVDDNEIPADSVLMDIAGALLYVEATLSGYGEEQNQPDTDNDLADSGKSGDGGNRKNQLSMPQEQIDNAHEAVIREARNGLEQAKTDIVEYIASQWDQSEIAGVPGLLQSIRGGLQIIPLEQAATLLKICGRFISEKLLSADASPDWHQLDTLADAITSIEYYLERVSEGSRDNDMILAVAEQSLAQLGYPVNKDEQSPVQPTPNPTPKESTVAASEAPVSAHEKETDQELIDDDIIEIFVEEAAEVLETITQHYPVFHAQPDDPVALAELRRAYHTLKGSGRLVGATSISELAWAVENMLNRYIEGSVSPGLALFELLEKVNNKLPGMVELYEQGQAVCDVADFIATADKLAAAHKQTREAHKAQAAEQAAEASAETLSDQNASTDKRAATSEIPLTAGPVSADQYSDPTAEINSDSTDHFSSDSSTQTREPEPVAAGSSELDDVDLIDDEIIEIFVEEATEVKEAIDQYLPEYLASYDNNEALTEVRRAFHTLKGSGRLVGASAAGELAWSVENLLNKVIDSSINMSAEAGELINQVVGLFPDLVDDFKLQRQPSHATAPLMAKLEALANGRDIPAATEDTAAIAASDPTDTAVETDNESELSIDPMLRDIFKAETDCHLETIEQFVEQARLSPSGREITDELSRAMHTLKGSANTAGIMPIAEIAIPAERFVKEARARGISVDNDMIDLLSNATDLVRKGLEQLTTAPQASISGTEDFLADLQRISDRRLAENEDQLTSAGQTDPMLINLFLTEGVDILLDAERILDNWCKDHSDTVELNKLVEEISSLERGAIQAGLPDIAELTAAMVALYQKAVVNIPADDSFYDLASRSNDALVSMMDQVAAGLASNKQPTLLSEIEQATRQLSEPLTDSADPTETAGTDIPVLEIQPEQQVGMQAEHTDNTSAHQNQYLLDPDLAEVFLEEANDLIASSGESLQQWTKDPHNMDYARALQRDIHTLKGGARLAGLAPMGELAHQLENLLEGIVEQQIAVSPEACHLSQLAHDSLNGMLISVPESSNCHDTPELISALQSYINEHPRQATATEQWDSIDPLAELEEADIDLGSDSDFATDHDLTTDSDLATDSEAADELAAGDGANETASMGLDEEMIGIFLEEANEIMQRSSEVLHEWSEDLENADCLAQLQRDLHTLKGGARMAEVQVMGDLAHQLETLFEGINEGTLRAHDAMLEVVNEAHDTLANMLDAVTQRQSVAAATPLIVRIQQLAKAGPLAAGDVGTNTKAEAEAELSSIDDSIAENTASTNAAADDYVELDTRHIANESYELQDLDAELVELFLEEAEELIDSTANNLQTWLDDIHKLHEVKVLQRKLHTLKGGARLAAIKPIGDLSHELESLFEGIVEDRFEADPSLADLLLQCHDRLAEMVENVSDNKPVSAANDLIQRIHHYCAHHAQDDGDTSPATGIHASGEAAAAGTASADELRQIFLDEAKDVMAAISAGFSEWLQNVNLSSTARELGQNLNILMKAAKLPEARSVSSLAEALSRRFTAIAEKQQHPLKDNMPATLERAIKYLSRLLTQIAELEQPDIPNELISELNKVDPGDMADKPNMLADMDAEILEVFVEEASDLRDALARYLDDWETEPRNMLHAEGMARTLHTLKGGSRLANLSRVGDLSQEFEAVIKTAKDENTELNDALLGEIKTQFGQLRAEIDKINELYQKLSTGEFSQDTSATQADEETAHAERLLQIQREQKAKTAQQKEAATAAKAKPKAQPAARQAPVENVRVPAPLIDDLVNLAGETSITRGLLEQQISDFTFTLDEMQATIDRLRGQLRRMDMETEAQILFSLEKDGGLEYEDFDPLEMDRYSSIQQLSRALSESTFDLTDLRETMLNKARDAETLLLQQSRINTELQEGLMKTRMIPFTSIVPRLRRIVRQIATELGKKVEFEVHNPQGELDRNVLERMVAPLEHMIRNAIGHGIEMPEERVKAGKPASGKIQLSVDREGGDVVLMLSDDGAGIDIDAVRKKATAQGLIDNSTATSDHDVLQFIFHAGFSTAKKVTQISGRGVGMDVVSSEIKQLSGRVSIDSKKGKGTRFEVHLPFTVSVNRALMVNTGEDYYAIPLNTIEGIVRVSAYELEEYYKPNAPLYEYAGQNYRLQYLGSLLKSGHYPKLRGQPLPLPVILVRGSGEQPLALQVDSLMGSREIVVKTLGTQFTDVRGVSGATILGDGNVVVILDLPAMLRSDFSAIIKDDDLKEASNTSKNTNTTVMVVDDSVTVRKVTSRLLERNGMDVLLAKDGVDAIALLQDNKPDVMLLDIEMPRMDGFEVASLVRHDSRLKQVPIVMITSRTGQKHRERAAAIGVNEYLGKPFQEGHLLETINKLVE